MRVTRVDRALEGQIVDLLELRGATDSICPSEVARALRPEGWRPLMEAARGAARRLAAEDIVEFAQQGRRVDPSTARGSVRIRRGSGWLRRDVSRSSPRVSRSTDPVSPSTEDL